MSHCTHRHAGCPRADLIRRPPSTADRTRAECERHEMVQFTQIERLVQITEGPLDERLDLPRSAAIAARHHEDWRSHAEIADTLQEIETGGLLHVPVVDHRQDNVQQYQVELLLQQQDEGSVGRACCRELIRVTVLELGKERAQNVDHDWLIVDDEDSLYHVRFTLMCSCAPHVRIIAISALSTRLTRTCAIFPAFAVCGRPMTSYSPVSSVGRSPIRSSIRRTRAVPGGSGGSIPDKGCWTGLAFGRFFFGRGLATPASVARRRNYRYTSDTSKTRLMRSQGC